MQTSLYLSPPTLSQNSVTLISSALILPFFFLFLICLFCCCVVCQSIPDFFFLSSKFSFRDFLFSPCVTWHRQGWAPSPQNVFTHQSQCSFALSYRSRALSIYLVAQVYQSYYPQCTSHSSLLSCPLIHTIKIKILEEKQTLLCVIL